MNAFVEISQDDITKAGLGDKPALKGPIVGLGVMFEEPAINFGNACLKFGLMLPSQ